VDYADKITRKNLLFLKKPVIVKIVYIFGNRGNYIMDE